MRGERTTGASLREHAAAGGRRGDDVGLPGMDGYEVARQLRAHAQLRSAVLIALTGYAAQHDRQQAADAGFDLHLAKSLKLAELGKLIASAREPGRSAAKRDA